MVLVRGVCLFRRQRRLGVCLPYNAEEELVLRVSVAWSAHENYVWSDVGLVKQASSTNTSFRRGRVVLAPFSL